MARGACGDSSSKACIRNGISDPGFFESFQSQLATVAQPAGAPVGRRVIATPCQGIIESQLKPFLNDFSLRLANQGDVDFYVACAFHSSFSREIGHLFIGADVFLAAVGIAAVVELVSAEENILGVNPFSQCQCEGKKYGISRRNVGDGNAATHFACAPTFGNLDPVG